MQAFVVRARTDHLSQLPDKLLMASLKDFVNLSRSYIIKYTLSPLFNRTSIIYKALSNSIPVALEL